MTEYFSVQLPDDEIRAISSIGLAHLGDAVFESVLKDSRIHRILPKEIVAQTNIEEIMRAITQTEEKQKYIKNNCLRYG